MPLPFDDWQFYVVSALAMGSFWMVVRPFLPRKKGSGESHGCPSCASGSAARRSPRTRLTVGGKRP